MSAHVQLHQASVLTGRQMVLAVTIGLHALAIMALMTVRTIIVPAANPPDRYLYEPLKEPEPVIQRVPIAVEPSEIQYVAPRPDVPDVRPVYTPEEVFVAPADPVPVEEGAGRGSSEGARAGRGVEIAPTALQFRAVRPSDDYYPSEAMTLGEEGIAIVKVCVGPTGRIDGKPTIDKSAGSPRLDRAAVAWAREALRFTPATENGVAVAACKGFRVNFTLH
jgi:TonB family protein